MQIIDEHTIAELTQMTRSSVDIKLFLLLLQRMSERVSDVRVKIVEPKDDTIQLRQGVVKVLEDMLLKPLSIVSERKEAPTPTSYL